MDLQPPPDDADRVFPRLGEEPARPKDASGAIFPILIVTGGLLVLALLLMLTGLRVNRDGGHVELKWGPEQACTRQRSLLCQEVNDNAAQTYADRDACRDADICIVPLGGIPLETINTLEARLKAYLNLQITVAPPLPISDNHMNLSRGQYNEELLRNYVAANYTNSLRNPHGIILALTAADIYLPAKETWRFAFGGLAEAGGHPIGVISTHRLASTFFIPLEIVPGFGAEISFAASRKTTQTRTYKMMLKYIGLGYFRLPLTSDPRSVLYNNILSVSDLDKMDDELPYFLHPSLTP
jgi:hypothetical protein